jgi:hypothetical protein
VSWRRFFFLEPTIRLGTYSLFGLLVEGLLFLYACPYPAVDSFRCVFYHHRRTGFMVGSREHSLGTRHAIPYSSTFLDLPRVIHETSPSIQRHPTRSPDLIPVNSGKSTQPCQPQQSSTLPAKQPPQQSKPQNATSNSSTTPPLQTHPRNDAHATYSAPSATPLNSSSGDSYAMPSTQL